LKINCVGGEFLSYKYDNELATIDLKIERGSKKRGVHGGDKGIVFFVAIFNFQDNLFIPP